MRDTIVQALKEVRRDHPWAGGRVDGQLRFHVACMAVCVGGIFALWYGSYAFLGVVPYWAVFLGVAFFTSILHEQEHDAIHANSGNFPFREGTVLHSLCLILFWVFRPNGINGIARTFLHKHHHQYSGQTSDFEEQAITNGMPWGIPRLLCLIDSSFTYFFRTKQVLYPAGREMAKLHPEIAPEKLRFMLRTMSVPFTLLHHVLVPFFLGFYYVLPALHTYYFVPTHVAAPPALLTAGFYEDVALRVLTPSQLSAVCGFVVHYFFLLGLPNMLRAFCLYFISSNMHYFGIDGGDVLAQTQVLDHWLFLPFNLFCWNFGKHHALHHYVVASNFMERELVSHKRYVYDVMFENGVLHNDFGTFLRANRRPPDALRTAQAAANGENGKKPA